MASLATRRTPKRGSRLLLLPVLLLLLLGAGGRFALAQKQPTAFQLQQFRPWADAGGGLQTQTGLALGQWNYFLGFMVNYAKDPLILRQPDGTRSTPVLGHQLGADLFFGLGLLSWLDVGLSLPLTLYQDGSIPDLPHFAPGERNRSLSGFAFGDMKLGFKAQALRQKKHWLNLAVQVFLRAPMGEEEFFNGEDGATFGLALLASKEISRVHLSLNLGYRYLPPTDWHNLTIQHELFYGVGARIPLVTQTLALLVDLYGSASLSARSSLDTSPLELLLGGRYYPLGHDDLALTLALGLGLLPGYGAPQFRVLLGVVWAPKDRDTDGDGLTDRHDLCPKTPGPKENHGCPWPDTDNDGLTDNIDRCPKTPGPKENKGCPWPDTDKDGLTDNIDKCPYRPGPKENKGCPWPDTDRDGLTDNIDRCPKTPGPKENKGCPWPDTDNDGVVDHLDKCPDVPGLKIRQGCPFEVLVRITKKEIKILQKIFFDFDKARIKRRSYPVLEQVWSVLKSRPGLSIRIEGHTDHTGTRRYNLRLSQRRANAVRNYLIRRGISPKRLQAKGYGKSRPLTTNRTKKGRAKNRRVQFKITSGGTKTPKTIKLKVIHSKTLKSPKVRKPPKRTAPRR